MNYKLPEGYGFYRVILLKKSRLRRIVRSKWFWLAVAGFLTGAAANEAAAAIRGCWACLPGGAP